MESLERRLVELHHDELQECGLGGGALAASLAATVVCPPLVMPLFVGGIAAGALGIRAVWRRWDLVDRVADDRDAYAIPEVDDDAAREARIERRAYYAALVRSWAHTPQSWVAEVTDELDELARDLEDESLELEPGAAVACRRLLTEPGDNPLFRDVHGAPALRARIARIRAGFQPSRIAVRSERPRAAPGRLSAQLVERPSGSWCPVGCRS